MYLKKMLLVGCASFVFVSCQTKQSVSLKDFGIQIPPCMKDFDDKGIDRNPQPSYYYYNQFVRE